jgi:hypothetical protein
MKRFLLSTPAGMGVAAIAAAVHWRPVRALHMDHVSMEFDGASTFIGSAHVYAPARDYARLGASQAH